MATRRRLQMSISLSLIRNSTSKIPMVGPNRVVVRYSEIRSSNKIKCMYIEVTQQSIQIKQTRQALTNILFVQLLFNIINLSIFINLIAQINLSWHSS
ncbi:hypothetical protein FGO68_gene9834 [Halteria grandinella]|uniref:Uncharacterized protein n=1 Tax=Halteria grandinella TaxID=5974 RepID=A0A8J8SUU0_HALGN|nr:hypothetical protein FGO68_gene9834 [Halteria grandinella]